MGKILQPPYIVTLVQRMPDSGVKIISIYFSWDKDDSIEYLTSRTGSSRQEASDSVTRIITFPGQACAPLYGYLKIKQLRTLAEMRLKHEFDVAKFHDVILSAGPMPLSILEDEVERWLGRNNGARMHSSQFRLLISCLWLIVYQNANPFFV
jgi:hypothetical protein